MFRFEWVAAGYFLILTLSAVIAPVARHRAVRAAAASGATMLAIVAAAWTLPDSMRISLPLLYLPAGYWFPAMLTSPGESRFEAWLRRHDAKWRHRVGSLRPVTASALEVAYLACYVVVPLALLVVLDRGTAGHVEDYWVAVLLAGFACYVTLPWLVSRPPRLIDDVASPTGIGHFNVALLRTVSHQFNTFPSGHVAVATAAALAVSSTSGIAGALFGVVAAGIAAGAAIGRYHYGIDVLAGILVGVVCALAVR
jgi:hypothetical protein